MKSHKTTICGKKWLTQEKKSELTEMTFFRQACETGQIGQKLFCAIEMKHI